MNLPILTEELDTISRNYAQKFCITRDSSWFLLKLQEEMGELIQSHLMKTGQARLKGKTSEEIDAEFRKELADVFGMLLIFAKHSNIDLEAALEEKWMIWKQK
jgi:NTP pyrophosphatase (non-canonical NTP hydrolase)